MTEFLHHLPMMECPKCYCDAFYIVKEERVLDIITLYYIVCRKCDNYIKIMLLTKNLEDWFM